MMTTHGSGQCVENVSEGVTVRITKTAEAGGVLNIYLCDYGCSTQHRKWPIRWSTVLMWTSFPWMPTRWYPADKQAVGKHSLFLTSYRALIAQSLATLLFCSQQSGKMTPTRIAHRSGQTLKSVLNPGERLHDYIRVFYQCFQGERTLYIIDDCSASKALTKKKDALSELAFSGRHAQQSVWVLTQKYNSVLKDLREQTRWVAIFYCNYCHSFEECLRENDVIATREERAAVKKLAETKHAKLLLKTDQPAGYQLL